MKLWTQNGIIVEILTLLFFPKLLYFRLWNRLSGAFRVVLMQEMQFVGHLWSISAHMLHVHCSLQFSAGCFSILQKLLDFYCLALTINNKIFSMCLFVSDSAKPFHKQLPWQTFNHNIETGIKILGTSKNIFPQKQKPSVFKIQLWNFVLISRFWLSHWDLFLNLFLSLFLLDPAVALVATGVGLQRAAASWPSSELCTWSLFTSPTWRETQPTTRR